MASAAGLGAGLAAGRQASGAALPKKPERREHAGVSGSCCVLSVQLSSTVGARRLIYSYAPPSYLCVQQVLC